MKKLCILLAIILLFTLAAGCKEKSADPTKPATVPTKVNNSANSTETAGATNSVDSSEATDAVMPSVPDPSDGTEPDEGQKPPAAVSIEKEFYTMLLNSWYRKIMGCTFDNPKNINAWYLFYNGVTNHALSGYSSFTEDEKSFVKNTFDSTTASRLPVAEINKDLSKYLGITINDIQIPERWVYYDKSDAYFFRVTDAYDIGRFSVTKVEQTEDGLTTVYWETNDQYLNTSTGEYSLPRTKTKMVLTMQLQEDGTYRVLSNLPEA